MLQPKRYRICRKYKIGNYHKFVQLSFDLTYNFSVQTAADLIKVNTNDTIGKIA